MITVTPEELPGEIGRLVLIAHGAMLKGGKVEVTTELGDRASQTQRYDTGRAANSTTATGKNPTPYDPGPAPDDQPGFYLRASRTEIRQAAEATILNDQPQDPAHVIQAAGSDPEGEPYPGFLEKRYATGQKAIDATEREQPRVQAATDKRAAALLRRELGNA